MPGTLALNLWARRQLWVHGGHSLRPRSRGYQHPRRSSQRQPHQRFEQSSQVPHGVEGTAVSKPPNAVLYAIGGYFTIINAGAVGLFWYDKQQALKRQWRVPERQLQLTGLLGGWIGGLWAMQTFRHKTVKKSFKEPYMACVVGNVLACMGAVAAWRYSPGFRSVLMQTFSLNKPRMR
ncbi:hypothetical protein BC832DRAFT_527869 [Gaertneriomyces semiglobifer]|nr:hypothetical protein BC832DRAFT_527869 [Gaertneriomyces semiglobifer]